MEPIVVYITASSEEEARAIAGAIVEERLAACANILRNVRSVYRWEGKVQDDAEVLMIVKTKRALFGKLQARVKELHSYTVPEIIASPVVEGSTDYLTWLSEETA